MEVRQTEPAAGIPLNAVEQISKESVNAWGRVVGLVVTALVLRTGIVSAKKYFGPSAALAVQRQQNAAAC